MHTPVLLHVYKSGVQGGIHYMGHVCVMSGRETTIMTKGADSI